MRVRSNWVTICADGFVHAGAYRAVDEKNELFLLEGFVTQRRMVLWARVTGIWFLSKIEKALYYAVQSLWRWKLRTEQHTTTNKNLISPTARPSNAFQIVTPHVIHILIYTARTRKFSTFYFCFRLHFYRNLFTLLNFNLRFVICCILALLVYRHRMFAREIGYNNYPIDFYELKNIIYK